ncbi:hypothetical protein [Paenibacillus sp. MMS20-IR301]|uniref:hypothetical protein n=1 Tax=Paenibacillus sp. MMS20-IR301 TaxID=2895946 RepID=UPI0028E9E98E|nr:hypothetical protein [Paenibacillus sp. MMS20-IR301]WNS41033.1 hypothetical protein LOS79_18475 [Paenibacillus sp. MMS20-IR301]
MRGFKAGRLPGREEGSVSIFLIMILAFVFLFTSVLIDYARIAAVNVQQERLARAALRSVMSSYDIGLRDSYGLFAFGGDDGDQLLSKVLNDNLYESGRSDAFNLLPVKMDSSLLEWSRPLGSYEIFRRQIIEEMKYKAPVDFALELAGKLKPLSAAMAEASRTTQVLGELQPLYDRREEALGRMLQKRRDAAVSAAKLLKLIMDPPADSIEPVRIDELASAADIPAMYTDYLQKNEADPLRVSDNDSQSATDMVLYETGAAEIIKEIPLKLAAFQAENAALLGEAEAALEEAVQLNGQMEAILVQSREAGDAAAAEDPARNWDIPADGEEVYAGSLKELQNQAESLILPASEIRTLENNIESQRNAALPMELPVQALPELLGGALKLTADKELMMAGVLSAAKAVNQYRQYGSIITAEAAQIESRRTSDSQRKEVEQQAEVKLGDAMKLLDELRGLGERAGEAMEYFRSLRQYYQEIVAFNNGVVQEAAAASDSKEQYAPGKSPMKNMDGLYAAISSVLGGARDRLYQTEYSAMYFTHFDLSRLFAPADNGTAPGILELAGEQLGPQAQELEYILYGFYNPAGNVAAAYGEIFALRLAVRTMEGLIEKAGLGNPLAVLAAGFLYGVEMAVQDMLLLSRDGELPLSKYLPAQLSYRDFLRLFLLLHGGGEEQLARMLALIRLKSGINPAGQFTYASAELTLGMPLWFLPGVVKLIGYGAGLSGDVRGKVYYRKARADFSY